MNSRNFFRWVSTTLMCFAVTFSYTQGLQRYPFRVYSTNSGLSQSSVYHILKDSIGYMWIGTGDGLNRLTPTTVEIFKHDFRDSTGLYSNAIRGLVQDSEGNIWIGTDWGLNVFDLSEKKIRRNDPNEISARELIIPIGMHKDQLLTMRQYHGIFCLDPKTGKTIRSYPFNKTFQSDTHFYTIDHNTLWTLTLDNKILKLDLKTGASHFIQLPNSLPHKNFAQAQSIKSNRLYFSVDSVFYGFDIETEKWHKIRSFESNILAIGFVNSDQIWVSLLGKGISRINRSGEILETAVSELRTNEGQPINLRNVSTIQQTDDGLVWLGVEGTGAVSISTRSQFQWISKNDPYLPGLTTSYCRSIGVLDPYEMLVGTYLGGLFHIDLKAKEILGVDYPEEVGNDITTILTWNADTLILSTETGVWILDIEWPFKLVNPKRITTFQTQHLARNREKLILATAQGLYTANPGSNFRLQRISPGYYVYVFIAHNSIYAASNAGISIYDPHFQKRASGGESLFQYGIKSLYVSANENIWVSTQNGLLEIDPQNFRILREYGREEKLPDNYIYGVLASGDQLWGSTNRGLFSLNPQTGSVRAFSQKDGLQGMEFNTGCFAHLADGKMVFGGIYGINVFDPGSVSKNSEYANVVLKKIWVNDTEKNPAGFENSLTGSDRNFVFEWDVLQWTNPEKIKLECKLVGQDTGYTDLENRNRIRYSALPPGNFTLLTRTVGQDGTPDDEQVSLAFHISPPFYLSWWFLSAASLAVLLILSALIYRSASLKYRKQLAALERQKEMDNLRKRISRDIHDDVGSDLSKIRMLLTQAGLTRPNAHNSKLQKLSEHALSGLSEVVWTVNSDYDHLPEMIAWFRTFAYDFFDSESIVVRVDSPAEIPGFLIDPDLRRNILMIYKEGLNNIVKHAGATEVKILFECSDRGLFRLSWLDNGKGFCTEKESCGNGLKNMRRRASESGLEFSLQSTPAVGTAVSISGILTQKYYENVRK